MPDGVKRFQFLRLMMMMMTDKILSIVHYSINQNTIQICAWQFSSLYAPIFVLISLKLVECGLFFADIIPLLPNHVSVRRAFFSCLRL